MMFRVDFIPVPVYRLSSVITFRLCSVQEVVHKNKIFCMS